MSVGSCFGCIFHVIPAFVLLFSSPLWLLFLMNACNAAMPLTWRRFHSDLPCACTSATQVTRVACCFICALFEIIHLLLFLVHIVRGSVDVLYTTTFLHTYVCGCSVALSIFAFDHCAFGLVHFSLNKAIKRFTQNLMSNGESAIYFLVTNAWP